MPTNLGIDDKLLQAAHRLGGHKSKRETVNEALAEYIRQRKRRDVIKLFGTIEFDPDFLREIDRRTRRRS